MSMLYPDPPHLSVVVYPGLDELECFCEMCGIAEEADCIPQDLIEVAPWDVAFELRSDLAEVISKLQVDREEFRRIIGGKSSDRPIRAGYFHQKFGIVIVEYLGAPTEDRHPIAISLSAGPLGLPAKLWRKADRTAAGRLVLWTKDLMKRASIACRALYGAIGIEISLATPSTLQRGNSLLPSEIFVSRTLLTSSGTLEAVLRKDFGNAQAVTWDHGIFLSGWAPYNDKRETLPDIPTRFRKSSVALGKALKSTN